MDDTIALRLGTFGPRGAGKTVSLSAAYLIREGGGLELEVLDADTIAYLRPLAEGLSRGLFPPPNPPKAPERLRWVAHADGRRYDLECIDFAGELTDPVWQAGPEEFKQQVSAWFGRCDAVLLFVDSTRSDPLYLDAIDKLLAELEQQTTRHGSRRRAVAVVMTKADELPGTSPAVLAAPEAVEPLLASHRVYQRLRRQLARKDDLALCEVFLSSAVGWNFSRVAEHARRAVEPCNLFEALRWAVEQAGALIHQAHQDDLTRWERELEELDATQETWWSPPYSRQLAKLDALMKRHHFHEGPLAQRALGKRRELLGKRRRRRLSMALAGVALVALALTGLRDFGRRTRTQIYEEYARVHREQPGEAHVRARLAFYDHHVAAREWDGALGLQALRDEADAWAAEDRLVLARVEADETFARLVKDDPALAAAGQHPRRHQNALDYLAAHRAHSPADRLDRLGALMNETREPWEDDRRAWREACDQTVGHPADYAARAGRLRAYSYRPDALARAEAGRLADEAEKQAARDREAYEKLRLAAAGARTSEALTVAEAQARQYAGAKGHGRAMGAAVRDYLGQLDQFKRPRPVYLTVKRARLPESFLERTWSGDPVASVTVELGKRAESTARRRADREGGAYLCAYDARLGPFDVTWGKKQKLVVTLEVHRSVFSNEKASRQFSDDVYILNHANGTLSLGKAGRKSSPVEVEVACEEARGPALPLYGER